MNMQMRIARNFYRLVGPDGQPHPVLDIIHESIEAAIGAARNWSSEEEVRSPTISQNIGVEVMTNNGSWRTIQYS